ncbi:MAG: DUF3261 domain-containing protein [Deltaproteobacteria bacterium]|nr:DUF3261 domain-containing protein [Deltaproteobacteria bacterium]
MKRPIVGSLLLLLSACAHPGPAPGDPALGGAPPDDAAYPGTLRPVQALAGDFLWRQRVTAHWPTGTRGFDAALQKRGAVLTLVGLSPMGTPAFTLTLQDGEIAFENKTRQELPFPPRFIVLDLQRVFYPWLDGPPPEDGERADIVDGERIIERYEGGHLVERTFERADATPPGIIRVTCEGYEDGARAPRHAELDNAWFGYRIVVETSDQRAL